MISSLLDNETNLGVEQAKLALVFLQNISQTIMADPCDTKSGHTLRENSAKLEEVQNRQEIIRTRLSSGSSNESNHETGSSITEGDDDEDSSSYCTAEEDHFYVQDEGGMRASDDSDDTMKTSRMNTVNSGSSTEDMSSNVEDEIPFPSLATQFQSGASSSTRTSRIPELKTGNDNVERNRKTHIDSDWWTSSSSPAKVGLDFKNLRRITASELQRIFNCFKIDKISEQDCNCLIEILRSSQKRDDFQWALHQLGGFNAILFLYGRVVEMFENDILQAKCLSLVLHQMKSQKKVRDRSTTQQKELIRFLLNSSKSVFGFQTFITTIRSSLNPKGNRIDDFELLNICLVSSWKRLIGNRCSNHEAPTGDRTLFECLLQIILELCLEDAPFREFNVETLKSNNFADTLLSICNYVTYEAVSANLTVVDALKMASTIKSLLIELMAPPDGAVAVSFIRFGLLPMLPKELPPLPRKLDTFFLYNGTQRNSVSNLNNVVEGEEVSENENLSRRGSIGSEHGTENSRLIEDDIPEVIGIMSDDGRKSVLSFLTKTNNNIQENLNNSQALEILENFTEAFQAALLEAIMSILLNSISILPDEAFRKYLEPNMIAHIFVAYCSHPNSVLKSLALQLLSAYLARVKNPILTEFIKSRGFFLTSLYTQANPELAPLVLQVCSAFGPLSYPLVNGLIYSNQIVNNVLQWIQHDESGVISSLLTMGFLPSVINFYNGNQQLPRPLVTLLSQITKYLVLSPKDEPWRILFCPGIESAPPSNHITSRILQDATEILRRYTGKELKKVDLATRLLWLIERCSCTRIGHQFDKWLLKVFATNIMEIDDSAESDGWRYFVKKYKRRLSYALGLFLCRIFAPNQGDLDFKQYAVRCLNLSCSNLANWFPKVIRSDDQIERCFTAFIRVFMSEAETRQNGRLGGDVRSRRPSFHSLISSNGNLVLTLKTAVAVGLPNDLTRESPTHHPHSQSISELDIHLSDRAVRGRFEGLLIEAGILSPTNTFATNNPFSSAADFKTFRILLEATPISGVSHSELRQCLTTGEKLRLGIISKSSTRRNNFTATFKIINNPSTVPLLTISNSVTHFESIFESVHAFSLEVLDVVTRMRTKQEIEVARRISVRDADITAKEMWWNIRRSLIHPKAPWHFPSSYPKFWALDQSEGPSRVRIRLRKEPLKIRSRFLKSNYQQNVTPEQPLDFLFESDSTEFLNYPVLQSEVEFIRFCIRIVPGEELYGEVILSGNNLYFFCETCHVTLDHCEKVTVPRTSILQILRRRYTLEDRAAEIFVDSQSYLFVFRTHKDREDFIQVFSTKSTTSTPLSLTTVMSQWVKGTMSSFDYLMHLNTAGGRTYSDLMQYPVFPFVLAKYDSPTLDLFASPSYRDLRKPMAIQDPAKEEHFVSTYNYLKRECDSTPFHYGSHYSNSGIVLHFLVRLPPYTQHFLKYQDGSFDIPDRSFHSIETTWKLASKDSNTDFKEAIPEFYYLPEFLQNLQHFDLGVRQNETRVDDVKLPPWAKNNARIFNLVNRQALESQEVRKHLADWIDLIFGYKQTGKPAVQAINVFHPSTYEGFEVDGDGADEVIQRARRAMISTYGQTPKRLFPFPHPKPQIQRRESCYQEVIDTVWGIRWGQILGSPASPDLDVISTREYREPVDLIESSSRVVFWPQRTLILGDSVVGSWDSSGIRIKANIIYLCVGDEISTCTGIDTTLWVGHQSGRISVLKLTTTLDKVLETVELVGHYHPIKTIDLNVDFSVAISCSGESYAMIWDMNRIAFANVIDHSESIDFVYSSRSTGDIILFNRNKNFVTLTTINGFPIGEVHPEEKIESACLTSMDPGRNVNLIAIGCDYGIIKFYSTWDLRFVNEIKVLPVWTLPIKSIRYSRDGRRLYSLSMTEGKHVTVALQLSPQQLRKPTSSSFP